MVNLIDRANKSPKAIKKRNIYSIIDELISWDFNLNMQAKILSGWFSKIDTWPTKDVNNKPWP